MTAYKGLEWAQDTGAQHLNYDAPGIVAGVRSTLKNANVGAMRVVGVNTGNPPTDAVWPDGRTAKEMFGNLKAALWWVMRERFQKTFEHVTWLERQAAEQLSDCNSSIGTSPAGDAGRTIPNYEDGPEDEGVTLCDSDPVIDSTRARERGITETASQSVTAGAETGDTETIRNRAESETVSGSIWRSDMEDDDNHAEDGPDELLDLAQNEGQDEDQGREHPLDELITLPKDCHTLVTQLSTKG